MKLNQKGIAHFGAILLILVVLGAGAFVGFRVLNASNKENNDNRPQETSTGGAVFETGSSGCTPDAPVAEAKNAFTELPFKPEQVKVVTLGKETNDARFVYPWVNTAAGDRTEVFAPATGKLYMIRHKVYEMDGKKGNDYDMFFAVDCKTVYRFNHISNPREDIKAAYPAGELPSGDYANGGMDIPERVKPTTAITVKAGESLGYTVGTPTARNFDFAVGLGSSKESDKLAVCPFDVFSDPNKTTLKNLLGPKTEGMPKAGYPCDIESKKF